MRILNVTQSYAPFFEFGGPPVKVRALSHELARRGHQVTVLTADWKLEERFENGIPPAETTRSPFGWRHDENGVQSIYLPTWLHYRALSWNPAVKRYRTGAIAEFRCCAYFWLVRLARAGNCGAMPHPEHSLRHRADRNVSADRSQLLEEARHISRCLERRCSTERDF